MINETIGIVIETNGEIALVRPVAHANCNSSYCCQGEALQQKDPLQMKNEIYAKVGETVVFNTKDFGMITVALVIFIMPLVLTFIGAIIGYYISELIGVNSSITASLGGVLLFCASLISIRIFDKSVSKNINLMPVITRKI